MKDVAGKTAFITGGASGIGLGLATVLAEADARVIIADLSQDHIDEAMGSLEKISSSVLPIVLDVSDREAMAQAAVQAEKAFGSIHILCNNAGINIIGPLDQATYEDWDWLLSVNLGGVINGITTFLPRMKSHGEGGHIVNTSSIAGIVAGPGNGIYTATKFAIRGLSESLRYDLTPYKIGVSVLCPGTVDTNLRQSEEHRPQKFNQTANEAIRESRAVTAKVFAEVLPTGMDPYEVGQKTLRGIQNNDFIIIPHPEFVDEFQASFDEIIAAIPDEPFNPTREVFEEQRRIHRKEARDKANALG